MEVKMQSTKPPAQRTFWKQAKNGPNMPETVIFEVGLWKNRKQAWKVAGNVLLYSDVKAFVLTIPWRVALAAALQALEAELWVQ